MLFQRNHRKTYNCSLRTATKSSNNLHRFLIFYMNILLLWKIASWHNSTSTTILSKLCFSMQIYNKSYSLWSSPIKLLKCARSIIAPILSEIFNISVTSEKYPFKLNLYKITLIFCRPIWLLCNFIRIFEKIMYNRIKDYIGKHNLLYFSQYGFRKGTRLSM